MSAERPNLSPTVEQQANCQENESLLLFSRVRNPIIRRQLIDFLYNGRIEIEKTYFEQNTPITFTREDFGRQLDQRLAEAETKTDITYENVPTDAWFIAPYEIDEKTGEKRSKKYLSIAEAHEKGHLLRPEIGPMFTESEIFQRAFSLEAITIEDSELRAARIDYFSNPRELVERMSQLKNYFGFKGAEVFTLAHLKYARTHYVEDTGMNNGMTEFFQAIPPEKEAAFVDLMNSAGI